MKCYDSYLGISLFSPQFTGSAVNIYIPTALLHDEIQLTAVSATQTELNAAISTITPAGLNLKEGITGTLLDKVIEFRNKEDSSNGIILDQNRRYGQSRKIKGIQQDFLWRLDALNWERKHWTI